MKECIKEQLKNMELKVEFHVVFDDKGKVLRVYRSCDIPVYHCEQCRFNSWCDKVYRRIFAEGKESKAIRKCNPPADCKKCKFKLWCCYGF